MCSTHQSNGDYISCCVSGCRSKSLCYFDKCHGNCDGQWAGNDVSCFDQIGAIAITLDPHWSIEYNRKAIEEFMKYVTEALENDNETKLREMALSLAAQLKWELSEEQWPASIYEVLDKVRKM